VSWRHIFVQTPVTSAKPHISEVLSGAVQQAHAAGSASVTGLRCHTPATRNMAARV